MDNECIHVIKEDKGLQQSGFTPIVDSEVGYTIDGREVPCKLTVGRDEQERLQDNPECYCKIVTINKRPTYYVRTDLSGNMLNPWGALSTEAQDRKLAKLTGKPQWLYQEVEEGVFRTYFKFLETRNAAYLRNCERKWKDG